MSKVDSQEPIVAILVEPPTPAELLRRFLEDQDEAAFAQLVERHSALVFSVCRRVLMHEHDAEDAFQATFLVLARKAGTIGRHASVGSWLYRVAYRIARDIKGKRARQPVQSPTPIEPAAADESADLVWRDLRPVLDDAVNSLPAKHRDPFVLCYFEGKSNEQAAQELGLPLGTVASRLSRARDWLRRRLERRGVALSVGALVFFLLQRTRTHAAPPELMRTTIREALRFHRRRPLVPGGGSDNGRMLAGRFLRNQRRARRIQFGGGLLATLSLLAVIGISIFLSVRGPKTDQDRLQGVWAAEHIEMAGMIMSPEGSKMTFQDNRWQLDCRVGGPADNFVVTATFDLRPTTTPTEIDFIDERGILRPGIYELKDDKLKICFSWNPSVRPRDFKPMQGNFFLYHLRRERE